MPLSDMMGMNESPEQWLMKRRVAGARDVRSLFALNNVVLADFEGDMSDMVDPPMPSNVSFDISFDEQEAMEAFESLMMNVEWVKSDVENALNDFFMSVGDAAE